MRINIRLAKKTVIHNSVELCTPENWRRLSFAFFAKYLPLCVVVKPLLWKSSSLRDTEINDSATSEEEKN